MDAYERGRDASYASLHSTTDTARARAPARMVRARRLLRFGPALNREPAVHSGRGSTLQWCAHEGGETKLGETKKGGGGEPKGGE